LTDAELKQWGWRIPFVIGALLSAIAFYIRSNLDETREFKQSQHEKKRGTLRGLLQYPKSVLTVMGLTMGGTVAFYTFTVYMQKYLINSAGLSKDQSTSISFFSLLVFALIQPLLGLLSDRIGRKPLLLAFGILGTLATVPLMTVIGNAGSVNYIFILVMCALLIVSGYTSINAIVKAELFPAGVRALGVGLPYALTTAIFGGTAEYIALWFKKAGHESLFFWYVTICILISLVVYISMKDTAKHSLITED
jgi:MHS family alpha-ketoglutarate permease-like MFS transporter